MSATPRFGSLLCALLLTGCSNSSDHLSNIFAKKRNKRELSLFEQRAKNAKLTGSIHGALLYLDDTQIRARPGKGLPYFDSCVERGCRSVMPGQIPFFQTHVNLPIPPLVKPIQNKEGEWANFIHIFPKLLGNRDKETFFEVQDSNLFMTAGTAYPLFFFRDETGHQKEAPVLEMRRMALESIRSFKRGNAYTYWPELPGVSSGARRVGGLNIPGRAATVGYLLRLIPSTVSLDPKLAWGRDVFDRRKNPYGADALGNIPNDADDTSLALVMEQLDNPNEVDTEALHWMMQFKDIDRTREDGRDGWKPKNSGGVLTWLKDEKEDIFADPAAGVIPLGVNNVDCVVNSNVLFALERTAKYHSYDTTEIVKLLAHAIAQKAWEKCGLYYPQRMIFPYSVTRAYRDGGAQYPLLKQAMPKLLQDLLAEKAQLEQDHPELKGAFPGGNDKTFELPTAMALTALLNMGSEVARDADLLQEYRKAIREGVDFLLKRRVSHGLMYTDTANRDSTVPVRKSDNGFKWHGGLYYSASFWDLAQWRSEAFTTSVVLEALTKYLLGYEESEKPMDEMHITIKKMGRNADDPDEFVIEKE